MLVLRRRPGESIVFDGGMRICVAGLEGQRAWLEIAAPGLDVPVTVAVLEGDSDHARIGVRSPRAVAHDGESGDVHVEIAPPDDTTLLVRRSVGERLVVGDLELAVAASGSERAELRINCTALSGPVVLSAFPASGGEVKLGIDAPREVRVLREEVWRELEAANTDAGRQWSPEELADLSATLKRR